MTVRDHVTSKIAEQIFALRRWVLAAFILITLFLAWSATQIKIDAGFTKMIPLEHEYMQTFMEYHKTFGGGNRILVALVRKDGKTILDPKFLETLKQATDDIFFIPGIDRTSVTSLFTPNTRYVEITELGFSAGNVIPDTYSGSEDDLQTIRQNILKSSEYGRLVATDFTGALIRATLQEIDPDTGEKLDIFKVAEQLEEIRNKYENEHTGVHIIGFTKLIDDIAAGTRGVLLFFAVAFVIISWLLYGFTRSLSLTAVTLFCAIIPVIWLLGSLQLLGFGIDPMSILVPFLIFAIGVSHAVQMTNAWRLRRLQGEDSLKAANSAFRELFIPGTLALATNALGFLVIMFIEIEIVRELGITASLGVGLMILTNKLLLPVLLSWLDIPTARLSRSMRVDTLLDPVWQFCASLARSDRSRFVLLGGILLFAFGVWKSQDLKTGDLGEGAPELHADSRYNIDNQIITGTFTIGVDVLSVIVQTHGLESACTDYSVMSAMDRFESRLRQDPGVQSVVSAASIAKAVNAAMNEGNPKMRTLPRDPAMLAMDTTSLDTSSGLIDASCNAMQILIFTRDHQGETIARIIGKIKTFAQRHNTEQMTFKLASGNVGVMAATNEAVDAAELQMLAAIFGALGLLCWLTFRSFSAVICILLPLALVSILCNALMAILGIGLKVSTLPVVALGVGVGVDYGIYLFDTIQRHMHRENPLLEAIYQALQERGVAALFTALTLFVSVGSWVFSDLKFQSDMGLLLAFMFLVNAFAAIFFLPALAATRVPEKRMDGFSDETNGVQKMARNLSTILRTQITLWILSRYNTPRDALRPAFKRYKNRVALITEDQQLTYGELQNRALRLAQALQAKGLTKGDRIFVLVRDDRELIEIRLACFETGIIAISFLPSVTPSLLQSAIERMKPELFIYDSKLTHSGLITIIESMPWIKTGEPYERWLNAYPAQNCQTRIKADDIAMLGFTSGTTGTPKILTATHGVFLTSLRLILKNLDVVARSKQPEKTLVGIPMSGAGSGTLLPTFLSGDTLVVPPTYTVDAYIRLIQAHNIMRLFTTPSLLIDLLDQPEADLPSLNNLIYGSELMPVAKLREALGRFGPILQQGYGCAECLPPVASLSAREHVQDDGPAPDSILSSAGRPVAQVQVIIADENDTPLPQGEIGQILIKSPTQFKGYLDQPELNAKVLRNGWLHNEDVGYIDADGYLHILGRKADLIRRKEEVIYPRLVEEVIHEHPAIKEAVFVQVGQCAVMAVSLRRTERDQYTESEWITQLSAFMQSRVAEKALPDDYVIMEELPRSALGKVLRREVREFLSDQDSVSGSSATKEPAQESSDLFV